MLLTVPCLLATAHHTLCPAYLHPTCVPTSLAFLPAAVRLDYSSLDGPARQRDRKNREAWERERLANIEEGKADLARLAPNLKVGG